MTEQVLQDPNAAAGTPQTPSSETVVDETIVEGQPGATDTPETNEGETDEQRNERVQRETEERSRKRTETFGKRIKELTEDKYAERRRSDELARENAELRRRMEQGAAPQPTQPQRGPNVPPQRKDYQDYEQYVSDLAAWNAAQTVQRTLGQVGAVAQQQRAAEERQRVGRELQAKQMEYAKTNPTYWEDVDNEQVTLPEAASEAVVRLPNAPAVLHHFARNPEAAKAFWSMSPPEQLLAMGELAASLKKPPQVSNAPPPGKPVGSKPVAAGEPPEDTEAYFKWAEKHMR